MEVFIVTGASRGLGAALVRQLLAPERRVVGIARSANDELAAHARATGAWLDWYLQDLADVAAGEALAASICAGMPREATRYVLINNAATTEPVGYAATLTAAPVVAALGINLAAAMMFTARFLGATDKLDADRRILNISSGLARWPIDGNGVYAATKAALDMFSRCVKAEQEARTDGRPVRIVSLAPGVMDTDMQGLLRNRDPLLFPKASRFVKMKQDGALVSASDAARKILSYLERDDFGATEIDDIRNV